MAKNQLGSSVAGDYDAWVTLAPIDESGSHLWRQNSISWEVKDFGKNKRHFCNVDDIKHSVWECGRDRNVLALENKCSALKKRNPQCVWIKANLNDEGITGLNVCTFSQTSAFLAVSSFVTFFFF